MAIEQPIEAPRTVRVWALDVPGSVVWLFAALTPAAFALAVIDAIRLGRANRALTYGALGIGWALASALIWELYPPLACFAVILNVDCVYYLSVATRADVAAFQQANPDALVMRANFFGGVGIGLIAMAAYTLCSTAIGIAAVMVRLIVERGVRF